MMKTKIFFISGFVIAIQCYAGVMPSQSRIIYRSEDTSKSLMLANTNDYPVIVQTWIDRGEGTPEIAGIPFISTPPVFRLERSDVRGVRLFYSQGELPQDRESLFWFNIYEIPPEKKNVNPENSVLVTMNTQIKLFYRPSEITITPEQAIKEVTCKRQGDSSLRCYNPAPIHISITGIHAKSKDGVSIRTISSELMMPPLESMVWHFKDPMTSSGDIRFDYKDDNGIQGEYILGPVG